MQELKGFYYLDEIKNNDFRKELQKYSHLNNQIETCQHTITEVINAIDEVLFFWSWPYIKNHWLHIQLLNLIEVWIPKEQLISFVAVKFLVLQSVENLLEKYFNDIDQELSKILKFIEEDKDFELMLDIWVIDAKIIFESKWEKSPINILLNLAIFFEDVLQYIPTDKDVDLLVSEI